MRVTTMKITDCIRRGGLSLGGRWLGRRWLGRWRLGGLGAAGLAVTSVGCFFADPFVDNTWSDEPDAAIMSTMHALGQGSEGEAGYTCSNISYGGGSSSSGDTSNNLWTRESTDGRGLAVEIGSLDQVLAQRYYGRDFAERGAVDQFVVTSASGVEYEFVYWGGSECEPCPPPPYEAPEGDPFGCDADADAPASDAP